MANRQFKVSESLTQWSQSATRDRLFLLFVAAWILPTILSAVLAIVNFSALTNQIPLFYSRLWGETQLANKQFLFLPIAGTFLLGIFNLGLATSFHSKDKVISYLLAGTTALVSALDFIAILNIIRLML